MPIKKSPTAPWELSLDAAESQNVAVSNSITFEQRLLAETVRLYEDAQDSIVEDPQADALAKEAGGDLEQKIVIRAQALPIAPSLLTALQHLRGASRLFIAIGLILAAIVGAGTVQVALGTQSEIPVNFFWVLGSILGVQTIALLVWLILIMVKPSAVSTGSLGGAMFALGRRATQWLHKGPVYVAAVRAGGLVFGQSTIGRWALSAVSHGLWLSFLSGALLLLLLVLSTKQYTFVWETTILSDQTYVSITRTMALTPRAIGFTTPRQEQIIDSHWTGAGNLPHNSREAWSGLLIGSVIVYGLLPRAVLLLFCLFMQRRASVRFRLDTTLPSYARLQPRLAPVSRSLGVVDTDDYPEGQQTGQRSDTEGHSLRIQSDGPTAIMGLEIDPPQSAWPPLPGVDWLDLGFVDSRADRLRALEQINSSPRMPRLIVIVCSMATTPDRGARTFIENLQQSTAVPVVIVLTEGQRLRARGHPEEVQQRSNDWHQLAAKANVTDDRILEADLDHLTAASRSNFARLIGVRCNVSPAARHIEQAFALILEHLRRWQHEPDTAEQAELHRSIAALYQEERPSWQPLLGIQARLGGDLSEQLRISAGRMIDLLPARLRSNPRWLAAGAMAGAMSCVVAATLFTPTAIASLPLWAGLGTALAAIIPPKPSTSPDQGTGKSEPDFADAIRSAALFALLLELQGYSEATITRIIDQVAGPEETVIADIDSARQWLDTIRQRLDQALAVEQLP